MKRRVVRKFFVVEAEVTGCPDPGCRNHLGGKRGYGRRGFFRTKWNGQPVPRYSCRHCGKWFSSHSFRRNRGQHRPDLNETVFSLYASGMTQRRMALVLEVNRKTVVRKFLYAAALARQTHQMGVSSVVSAQLQFDEMETFEHTRLKPVTIAIAVEAKSGAIIDTQAAQMGYKGPLAALAFRKYGPRLDESKTAIIRVLTTIAQVTGGPVTLTTDKHPRYPKLIASHLPGATHVPAKRSYEKTDRKNKNDQLFTLNYTAAKIRNDLSRMSRKTWVTTKKIERLQAHLDLYTAYNNRYSLLV